MALRPARPADAPAITRIFQAARAHSLAYLPILHTDAEDHAFFARSVERGGVTVAESGGAVVAFLALDGDEIDHLYVDPRHHRQGQGAALLGHAQAAREHLELWVFQRNLTRSPSTRPTASRSWPAPTAPTTRSGSRTTEWPGPRLLGRELLQHPLGLSSGRRYERPLMST